MLELARGRFAGFSRDWSCPRQGVLGQPGGCATHSIAMPVSRCSDRSRRVSGKPLPSAGGHFTSRAVNAGLGRVG